MPTSTREAPWTNSLPNQVGENSTLAYCVVLAILEDEVADGGLQVQGTGAAGRDGVAIEVHGDAGLDVGRVFDLRQGHAIDGGAYGGQVVGAVGHADVHDVDGRGAGIVGKGDVVDDVDGAVGVDIDVGPILQDLEAVVLGLDDRGQGGEDQGDEKQHRPNRH